MAVYKKKAVKGLGYGARLSDEELQRFIEMWKAGSSLKSICVALNRPGDGLSSVARRLAKIGMIKPRDQNVIKAGVREKVRLLWKDGLRRTEIAEKLYIKPESVTVILRYLLTKGEIDHKAVDENRIDGKSKADIKIEAEKNPEPPKPYKGLSGVEIPPWPPRLKGMPLLGGIGQLPNPPGVKNCQWIISDNVRRANWRSICWCPKQAMGSSPYCHEHDEETKTGRSTAKIQAPIHTTMLPRFGE